MTVQNVMYGTKRVSSQIWNSSVAKTSNYPLTDTGLPSAAGPVGRGSLKPSNPLPLMTIENGDRRSRLNLSNAVGGLMEAGGRQAADRRQEGRQQAGR